MRILSLLILLFSLTLLSWQTRSPHGPGLKISCTACHSSKGWYLDKEIYSFDHNTTRFPLTGQHTEADCRQCHTKLVFNEVNRECYGCHNDVHQSTAGPDCSRCHKTVSWLVNNINEIHQVSRFPLIGPHRTADCYDCHKSESLSRFDIIGINCIDCHRQDYMATSGPNHFEAGFSEECSVCHSMNSFSWSGAGFNHNFFPLTLAHASPGCSDCHKGNYKATSPECYSCHESDYAATLNPDHKTLGFPNDCKLCHSLNPGWRPAAYTQHDSQFFPVYSGNHRGEWNSCTECHPSSSDYSVFSCLNCHEHNKTDMDEKHQGRSGYSYTSNACLLCHPRGEGD